MKVITVLHHEVFGGPHNQALRLHEPLRRSGVELAVVLPPGGAAARLREAGVPTLTLDLSRLRATLDPRVQLPFPFVMARDVIRLARIFRRAKPDVVVLSGLANPHGALAARLAKVPVVWQVVDTRVPPPARELLMSMVRRYADTVMFWGEALMDQHVRGRPLTRPVVLTRSPVPVDVFVPSAQRRTRTRQALRIPTDAIAFGAIANINPQKGLEYFVDAAGLLWKHRADTYFVIAGPTLETHRGYLRRLRSLVEDHGIPRSQFIFAGPIDSPEEFYPGVDCLVISSVPASEGIPTTALESMACGVPVITTRVGAAAEVVRDGDTGLVVPPMDAEALMGAMLELRDAPARRTSMGTEARVRVVSEMNIDGVVSDHLRAFKAAVATGRPIPGDRHAV